MRRSPKKHTKRRHGWSYHSLYPLWHSMKVRCYDRDHHAYARYGGRGIRVSKRWYHSLKLFAVDMGKRPKGATLDRIDNNKGYNKNNCRWSTWKEQQSNRGNNVRITWRGKTLLLKEWAVELDINYSTLHDRVRRLKWSIDRAFTRPISKSRSI